jgi:hypothetical protein
LLVVLCIGAGCCRPESSSEDQLGGSGYFVEVPIEWKEGEDRPYVRVAIGEKSVLTGVDLGFRGHLSLSSDLLQEIPEARYMGEKQVYNFRGNRHSQKVYSLPQVRIGKWATAGACAQESSPGFRKEVTISKPGEEERSLFRAKIGWELFSKTHLLIDCANGRLALADGWDTLGRHGYSREQFVEAPLLLDRGLVECEVDTGGLVTRCLLDTGSSWNIINAPSEEGRSVEEMVWGQGAHLHEVEHFFIQGIPFGPISFHPLPLNLPIPIDCVLGMEFFRNHTVFIDFQREILYIERIPKVSQKLVLDRSESSRG